MRITRIAAARKNGKTRIAVYCRVSTTRAEQEDSLEIQKAAYTALVGSRSDWELVKIYADSISGLSAEKRPEFMQMIRDSMEGKIDHILCKSVSRFSRNAAECQKYTDLLLTRNIGVAFEKEHLKTDDPANSFMLSLMSAVAENESRSISENVRWSYRERFKRGEYNLGNNRILGYDSVDGKLVPNKDAGAVRLIYDMFLNGSTIEKIRKGLAEMGVLTSRDTLLSRNNIYYILRNEAYKGDKLLQKKPPQDFITKKPNPLAEYESHYLTNDHEPIVDKAVWEAVQEKLARNRAAAGHRGGLPHAFGGRFAAASAEGR